MDEVDLQQTLTDLAATAKSMPELSSLRSARLLLTSPGFARQLDGLKRTSHNFQIVIADCENSLLETKFAFRDMRIARSEAQMHPRALLVGGGSTIVGGSALAAATQSLVNPALALLAIGTGAYAAWRGMVESNARRWNYPP